MKQVYSWKHEISDLVSLWEGAVKDKNSFWQEFMDKSHAPKLLIWLFIYFTIARNE